MKFVKMHGAGNDYIYVDAFKEKIENPVELAKKISHRHFGVGGDGLILIKPFSEGHGEMEMYNADGSMSEMCGNGIRCVAKYLHDYYYPGQKSLKILTGAGVLSTDIANVYEGKATRITVDMGEPIFNGLKIPTTLDKEKIINESLHVNGEVYTFSSVSMGNPHCVIFVDDVAHFPVQTVGPLIENHSIFPKRVNVEFVQVVSSTQLIQRTWERGSGETWACGTGASAVAVVANSLGICGDRVEIQLLGGTLILEYSGKGSVKMTGPAEEVFWGEWNQ